MKITRENYEIYFVQYIDGTLPEEDLPELKLFRSQNPDLSEILENYRPISVNLKKIIYPHKDKLYAIPFKPIIITDENFDVVCLMKIEGELTPAQEAEFEIYLKRHPEKQPDYLLYTQTKSIPESPGNKEELEYLLRNYKFPNKKKP